MSNLAEKIEHHQPQLTYGSILERSEKSFTVRTDSGDWTAEKAFSCVVQPEKGDYVLLSIDDASHCFVLAVLQRNPDLPPGQDIVFEGPARIHVVNGDLALTSDQGMTLAAEEDILCASDQIEVQALRGEIQIGTLTFLGRAVRSQVDRVVSVAKSVERTCEELVQRMKSSLRYVDGHDESQSRSSRQLVEETLTVQSKNSYHLTEEVVKIDAEQIHLG